MTHGDNRLSLNFGASPARDGESLISGLQKVDTNFQYVFGVLDDLDTEEVGTNQKTYNSVAAMVSDSHNEGDSIKTLGYWSAGDGGGNSFVYKATGRGAITTDSGFRISGGGAADYFLALNTRVANVLQFGAKGNDVTADATAIQSAADSGASIVYYPYGVYRVATPIQPAANQVHYSDANAQVKSTTAASGCFDIDNNNVTLRGIHCVAEGSDNNEKVIEATSASELVVEGCTFSNHLGVAVYLYSVTDSVVHRNKFVDAIAVSAGSDVNDTLVDIRVTGASRRVNVTQNMINSGCGIGVEVQGGINTSGDIKDVSVVGNQISGSRNYGINVYRAAVTTSTIELERILVADNIVTNIQGDLQNSLTSNNTHGAGIYLQAVDEVRCVNNVISYTNLSTNNYTTLTPGGIGINDCGHAYVTGNKISNVSAEGIHCTIQDETYAVTIADNEIVSSSRTGIMVRPSSSVSYFRFCSVRGNTIKDAGGRGIFCWLVSGNNIDRFDVSGNTVDGCSGTGIEIPSGADYVIACSNTVLDATNNGIQVANATAAIFSDNWCRDVAGVAFACNTAVSDVTFTNNIAELTVSDTGQTAFSIDKTFFRESHGNVQTGYSESIPAGLNNTWMGTGGAFSVIWPTDTPAANDIIQVTSWDGATATLSFVQPVDKNLTQNNLSAATSGALVPMAGYSLTFDDVGTFKVEADQVDVFDATGANLWLRLDNSFGLQLKDRDFRLLNAAGQSIAFRAPSSLRVSGQRYYWPKYGLPSTPAFLTCNSNGVMAWERPLDYVSADDDGDTAPSNDTSPKQITLQKRATPPTNAAYIAFSNNPGGDTFYLVMEEYGAQESSSSSSSSTSSSSQSV